MTMTVAAPWNPVHASFRMTGTCKSLVFDVDLLRSVRRTRQNHVDLNSLPDFDGSNVRSPSTDLFYFRVGIEDDVIGEAVDVQHGGRHDCDLATYLLVVADGCLFVAGVFLFVAGGFLFVAGGCLFVAGGCLLTAGFILHDDEIGEEGRVSLLRPLHGGVELACKQLSSYLSCRNCLALVLELCCRPDDERLAVDRDDRGRDTCNLTAHDNLGSISVADCGLGVFSLSLRLSSCLHLAHRLADVAA